MSGRTAVSITMNRITGKSGRRKRRVDVDNLAQLGALSG